MKNTDINCVNCAGSKEILDDLKRFHNRILQAITAIDIIHNSDCDHIEIDLGLKCAISSAYETIENMQVRIDRMDKANEH
ncbi:hypothetical protein [Pantoea stewartii]|uniref:Phage protein n=1 Tax=Pantoea stewartii subsp. stewartii DC283 TaxID=660596 RepID=H3RBI4_PANSE|nr:hypothetical protein [Pantoea stewartii]ARF49628.1 hypothetical protein DSJ_09930 [Pantoea stewartii subsp. stewartii DC283]EHU01323.1 hypothetical protein CKS_4073 [Pantoea stewartii subsp. stewartii DC283]KAB0559991.1 hypothetical protein F7Q90_00950 [Pantoea stewartii subsp. stewartii]